MGNVHSFQRNEQVLIMDQRPTIPFTQLVNPVNTPDQDERDRNRQKNDKDLKRPRQGRRTRRHTLPFPVAVGILQAKGDEHHNGSDLERQTGNGDVDGGVASTVRSGGQRAADGLQDQGEDVAGDEDPVVEARPETGVLRTEVDDTFFFFGSSVLLIVCLLRVSLGRCLHL